MSGPGALPALPAEVHQGQPGQQEGQDRVTGQFSYNRLPSQQRYTRANLVSKKDRIESQVSLIIIGCLPAEVYQGHPGQQEGQD